MTLETTNFTPGLTTAQELETFIQNLRNRLRTKYRRLGELEDIDMVEWEWMACLCAVLAQLNREQTIPSSPAIISRKNTPMERLKRIRRLIRQLKARRTTREKNPGKDAAEILAWSMREYFRMGLAEKNLLTVRKEREMNMVNWLRTPEIPNKKSSMFMKAILDREIKQGKISVHYKRE